MTIDSNAAADAARPRVLILAGTTASGKTEVSIPLAKRLEGEIISADSRQVYRELRIGTARPSAEQLAAVAHHFIAHKSIRDRWTAGDFSREGRRAIDEILSRDRTPIIVGGSMLYLKALLDGFFEEDAAAEDSYVKLKRELRERGGEVLYEELLRCDPELAARTDPRDHHRILRGLAVYRASGVRLSDRQAAGTTPLEHPWKLFFLHGDRQETYARVNERVIEMIDEGLVDEVRQLFEQGYDETNCNALRTHGYQEVFPFLRRECTREEMIEEIQKAVRHYVKRQMTWFRADARAVWVERSFSESPEDAADRIAGKFLE